MTQIAQILTALETAAAQKLKVNMEEDDGELYDKTGGNINDAYELGIADGEVWFARQLLRMIKEES